jgi:hypothetical protein
MTQYGHLTLLRILPERAADKHIVGLWRCDCGKEKPLPISRVRTGITKSCGCLKVEILKVVNRTHGQRYTKEYRTWTAIKGRCHVATNKDYPNYGAKGLTVFQEWRDSFEAFFAHIGLAPTPAHQIERKDNRRGYEPGNVKWATVIEQSCNRSTSLLWTIEGHLFESAQEAGDHYGVSDVTIHRWVKGYFDTRRGTFRQPKSNCYVINKY